MTGERMSSGPAKPETREPRDPNNIGEGYFAYRFVKGGPEIAARIWRPRPCVCTVNGGDSQDEHQWQETCDRNPPQQLVVDIDSRRYVEDFNFQPDRAPLILRVWLYGRRLTKAEYELMLAQAEWDRLYNPSAPSVAAPDKPIDINKLPSLF